MRRKLVAITAAVGLMMGVTTAVQAGSEAPIVMTGTNKLVWTNTTVRQWVGSVVCTYTTSRPSSEISISLVDSMATNLLAYAANSNMQTMYYVSERGPIVINKGNKIVIDETASQTLRVVLNNLTGE